VPPRIGGHNAAQIAEIGAARIDRPDFGAQRLAARRIPRLQRLECRGQHLLEFASLVVGQLRASRHCIPSFAVVAS